MISWDFPVCVVSLIILVYVWYTAFGLRVFRPYETAYQKIKSWFKSAVFFVPIAVFVALTSDAIEQHRYAHASVTAFAGIFFISNFVVILVYEDLVDFLTKLHVEKSYDTSLSSTSSTGVDAG